MAFMLTTGRSVQDSVSARAGTQDSPVVDELDLAVVNCLQIHPRASWTLIGAALGVDPVTVARRWQQLSDSGTAWVTGRAAGHGAPESCLAVIELSCAASETLAIAHRIAQLPYVLSVEHTSGPRALTMLAEIRDLSSLSRFLLESLGGIPGIVGTRSHAITKVVTMGDQWRLKVLDRTQVGVMTRGCGRHEGAGTERVDARRPYDGIDRRLILLLGEDGRMPVATLAARTGSSESTVRRRLADLINHDRVVLRCDIALAASGWRMITWIWAYCRPDDNETISAIIQHVPGVRVCWRIAGGRPNLLLALNTHSMYELPIVEAQLTEIAPRLAILDRSIVLRSIKRAGRQLDADGRSVATVPIDIWSSPA
jgi:DNA-binding Lrp family transcriptional regulator